MRLRSAFLLVGIFLLLVPVVSIPLIGLYTERRCDADGTDCETGYRLNIAVLLLTSAGVLAYLLVAPRVALALASRRNTAVGGERARQLKNVVEEMAIAAGVPVPRSLVVDDPSLNAFAMPVARHGAVVVTSGAIEALDRRELSGVVAPELGHLRHRDSRVVLVAAVAVALIVQMQRIARGATVAAWAVVVRTRRARSWWVALLALMVVIAAGMIALVLTAIALPLALLMRAALSRRREELADAAAVQYTRDPGGLRKALEKIAASNVPETNPSLVTQPLWIDAPTRLRPSDWIARLLATHPPIEDRIAWLRALEGASATGK
jgi:heat shock protein HtpX